MKLAYLTSQYARAGDTFIRGEVAELRRQGHEVHTFSIRRAKDQAASDAIEREQASTEYILERSLFQLIGALVGLAVTRPVSTLDAIKQAWTLSQPGVRGRVWPLFYLVEAAHLARRLEAHGVEHLHNHIAENSAAVAMLASALSGIPWSLTVHGPSIFYRAREHALDRKIASARFVACISHYCLGQCMMFSLPEDWSKLHIVRCGVDASFLREPSTDVAAACRLVCVGRLCAEKGQVQLVDAMAMVKARGISGELVLVGDGPMRGAIEQRITHHRLNDQIHITGWAGSDEVRQTIRESRALVLPSFAEGLPIVLMEALALGRAVVTTPVAAIPELVTHADNGWLVPAGDVVALSAALEQALGTAPDELNEMGQRGRARVAEIHNEASNVRLLARLFAGEAPEATLPMSDHRPHQEPESTVTL